ncbi:hypothetical protein [Pengzhenrongella phosphoraccumulans]|uniref:hypothetical protein n=1 Tax=Pengzhenrongella phosphoraccumulans TaxID=3114394 RepID=UPI00388FAC76
MKRRSATAVVALTLVVAAAGTASYRYAYGTWWQTPQRISYCDRTYLRGTAVRSGAEIRQIESTTTLNGDAPYMLEVVGKVPPVIGQPLLAVVPPDAKRANPALPCSMGIYLKNGPDSYLAYGLSGGP